MCAHSNERSFLELREFSVSIRGRPIVSPITETFSGRAVLMGPNGSGKSSLALAIAGHPSYTTSGEIFLNGKRIDNLPPEERAKEGLFLTFQDPPPVEGLPLRKLLAEIDPSFNPPFAHNLLSRAVNYGFSGGEKKRAELLQLLAFKPKFAILDEIDSGLDVDGIKLVSSVLEEVRCSFLFITHNPSVVRLIHPEKLYVMVKGRIVYSGSPKVAEEIAKKGYSWLAEAKFF